MTMRKSWREIYSGRKRTEKIIQKIAQTMKEMENMWLSLRMEDKELLLRMSGEDKREKNIWEISRTDNLESTDFKTTIKS